MSWVTVVWSMIAAACLTMAIVNAAVWWWRREALANVLFAVTAVATTFFAAAEMWMMHAGTPEQFATAMRWAHVPLFVLIVALVGFVRVYLDAGRRWLAWSVVGLRSLALVLNFLTGVNLNFREITEIRRISFLGEEVSVAAGVTNPWILVAQAGALALLFFVADASLAIWRRGDRRKALLVGGSIVFFVLAGLVQSFLVVWGIISMPIILTVFFVGIVAAMGFELSRDVLRAGELLDELRESDERISLATDSAKLGLWVWDLARDEIWATPQFRSMFGFGADERITIAAFRDRVHPDDREAVESKVRRAVDAKQHYEVQYRLALPDGAERWIAAAGRAEREPSGKRFHLNGVCRDITERRQAELKAQRLQHEMTHVGRVSMMGQFASALAHEINQPLGAILRNAEAAELFLQSENPDIEEIRAILADIRRDDQRASSVIERMRTLLRRHDLDTRMLDVAELVGNVVALARPDAVTRRVKLEVQVPADLPPVRGDRVHLQQVLLNLILNGMDALNGAGPEHRLVSVGARLDSRDTVEVSVSDTGHGIAPETLTRVFDQFFTTKTSGMGMGLSISRSIIEAHGGRLWAESDSGGATFRFTLKTVEEATAS